jgi:hypothetical protein
MTNSGITLTLTLTLNHGTDFLIVGNIQVECFCAGHWKHIAQDDLTPTLWCHMNSHIKASILYVN